MVIFNQQIITIKVIDMPKIRLYKFIGILNRYISKSVKSYK